MSEQVRLITSGAYIDQELSAEFGLIPPAFLPIGTSRLYEAQLARFKGARTYMTVPEDYVLTGYDLRRLNDLDVELIPVPVGIRLGESILYALNYIQVNAGSIHILYGDTLIEDPLDHVDDLIAYSEDGDDYSWAEIEFSGNQVLRLQTIPSGTIGSEARHVACGYFTFSNSSLLIRALTRSRGDFIAALNFYCKECKVSGKPVQNWRDFGHIQPYFKSRRLISTARSFNHMEIANYSVRKSSADRDKMRAEIHWLSSVPPEIIPYTARLIQYGDENASMSYETEYQFAPTLSELFVFSSIGRPTWKNILNSCFDFLSLCSHFQGDKISDNTLKTLVSNKTVNRLEQYAAQTGFDITAPNRFENKALPSLVEIAEHLTRFIDFNRNRPETVMHGDFCLSNILFNSRAGKIVVIDPRGYVEAGKPTIFGDIRYDLAKMLHSILGRYDHILAGQYAFKRFGNHEFSISFEHSPSQEWLLGALSDFQIDGIKITDIGIRSIMVHLFLSMLPLHDDRPDRQSAFIANALRLFVDIERD